MSDTVNVIEDVVDDVVGIVPDVDVEDVEDVDKVETVDPVEPLGLQEKADLVHSNTSLVYEAGQKSMVDEDKIINKTASGTGFLYLDDVSEIPHAVQVKLSSKNLFDVSVLEQSANSSNVTVDSANAGVGLSLDIYPELPTGILLKELCKNCEVGKTYTVSAMVDYHYIDTPSYSAYLALYNSDTGDFIDWHFGESLLMTQELLDLELYFVGTIITEDGSVDHACTIAYIQVEEGEISTEFTPYITDFSGTTVTACGANLFNKDSEKLCDGADVIETGVRIYAYNTAIIKATEVLKPNTTYYVHAEKTYSDEPGEGYATGRLYWSQDGGVIKILCSESITDYAFTTPDTITGHISGYGYVDNAESTKYVDFNNLYIGIAPYSGCSKYVEPVTYTPNADDIVNIKSISPIMNILCDTEGVNISADYNKSYGMQLEHDRFWDNYQLYGKKTSYNYAFYDSCWNDENFKPKYDIKIVGNGAASMFAYSKITNIKQTLEDYGVTLDTSQATQLLQTFQGCASSHLPVIDARAATNTSYCFGSNAQIEEIEKLIVAETTPLHAKTFNYASKLKNIIFEGVIGSDIDFQYSTLLSKKSIVSVVNCLTENTTDKTLSLSLTAVNNAFETAEGLADGSTSEEWLALVATKTNWSVSLV